MKTKRPTLRKHDRVVLAPHKSVIPPYDGKPYVLRDTVLTVSHLTGTGTQRSPWHVVVTDGTHFWHLEPEDVTPAERHHATMKSPAQLQREIDGALAPKSGSYERPRTLTVEDGNDRAVASRTTDDDGWVVELSDGYEKEKRFYQDSGGAWLLQKNGVLGRQLRGTKDERAPKDANRMRSFLRSRVLGTL
jgi:hypothetical protein